MPLAGSCLFHYLLIDLIKLCRNALITFCDGVGVYFFNHWCKCWWVRRQHRQVNSVCLGWFGPQMTFWRRIRQLLLLFGWLHQALLGVLLTRLWFQDRSIIIHRRFILHYTIWPSSCSTKMKLFLKPSRFGFQFLNLLLNFAPLLLLEVSPLRYQPFKLRYFNSNPIIAGFQLLIKWILLAFHPAPALIEFISEDLQRLYILLWTRYSQRFQNGLFLHRRTKVDVIKWYEVVNVYFCSWCSLC